MIRLTPVQKPKELTDEVVVKLTQRYKDTSERVWGADYISEALLAMSNQKCCFSECMMLEEGKYVEVEHFHPKSIYPDEVVEWNNLLPISKPCNVAKDNHDTKVKPIINPLIDDPKNELYFKAYRLYGKTALGKKTIEVVDLNDRMKWVNVRFDIGERTIKDLEDVLEKALDFDNGLKTSTIHRNKMVRKMRELMSSGTPKAAYSATVATVLLNEDEYTQIKAIFTQHNLWTAEFETVENELKYCALDTKP
jgi:uncharacterized protein (TIGR02646 family)